MTAATVTREELVDRYVALDALEAFMRHLMHPKPGAASVTDVLPADIYREALDKLEGPLDVVNEADRLLGELWPNDGDLESREYANVARRSDLLTARLFVLAATRADAFAAEAAGLIRRYEEDAR